MSKISFFRSHKIILILKGESFNERAFPFDFYAGFCKEVDPLSGMAVNLILVDGWMHSLERKRRPAFASPEAFLKFAWSELYPLAATEKAELKRVGLISHDQREITFDGREASYQVKKNISLTVGGKVAAYQLEMRSRSPQIFSVAQVWIEESESTHWNSVKDWRQSAPPEISECWLQDPISGKAESWS